MFYNVPMVCCRFLCDFETLNYKYMKTLNRITKLRNLLKPLLVLCGVLRSFFSRLRRFELLRIDHEPYSFGISIIAIGLMHEWNGSSNYSTKTFMWISYWKRKLHFGMFFLKIA